MISHVDIALCWHHAVYVRVYPSTHRAPMIGVPTGGCQSWPKVPLLAGVIGERSAAKMVKGEACDNLSSEFTRQAILQDAARRSSWT